MERINIAKLLKNCPSGMELDCTMYDCVFLEGVMDNLVYPIIIKTKYGETVNLTSRGCWGDSPSAKCVIFPKGKTTWEGFVPLGRFKDGDIVTCNDRGSLVACIYKGRKNTASFNHHIALYKGGLGIVINGEIVLTDDELSFATEEEKERLFQEIKNNGYKWNVETKTLEKTNKPIFKVGQKIKIKNDSIIEIKEITDYYYISTNGYKFEIKYQDNYELMPNKFDISSLIPFESKVLVRSENHNIWKPAIFGFFVESNKNFYVLGGTCWTQCIPYEGNEYLFKTTDDCDEYYKIWEK